MGEQTVVFGRDGFQTRPYGQRDHPNCNPTNPNQSLVKPTAGVVISGYSPAAAGEAAPYRI